jgi:NADH-quinone oxidoreductase subunit K
MADIGLNNYLILSGIVFTLGVAGIFFNRRSVLSLFMAIELILLAVNLNFVAFAAELHDLAGQVFAFFVLTVAAAETAIGLAILIIYYRSRSDITVDNASTLKG